MSKRKTYPEEVAEAEELLKDDSTTIREALDEIVAISQELDLYDDQIQNDEIEVAKLLKGTAEHFELDPELIDRMVRHGVAAQTEDGLMRGFKWDSVVKVK